MNNSRARAIARRQVMEKRNLMSVMKQTLELIRQTPSNVDKNNIKKQFVRFARIKFSLEGPRGDDLVPMRTFKAWEKFHQAYRNYMNSSNKHLTHKNPNRLALGLTPNGRYVLVNNPGP